MYFYGVKAKTIIKYAKIWSFSKIVFVFVKILPVFGTKPKIRGRRSLYTSSSQP